MPLLANTPKPPNGIGWTPALLDGVTDGEEKSLRKQYATAELVAEFNGVRMKIWKYHGAWFLRYADDTIEKFELRRVDLRRR